VQNTVNDTAIKKLKLLFTVVDRPKAEFYLDVLSQYEVNCQMVTGGMGTAQSELIDMLGLNIHKAVIVSVVREDRVDGIMKVLEQKFETIKNGKGIAFAVPLSSVIGVNNYQFLSNYRQKKGE
jgi:nitrogen regulatory protein PII